MAIRIREDGRMVCAAMFPEEPGDRYIDDGLHYQLSVISRAILPDPDHETNGLWHWVHGDHLLEGRVRKAIRDRDALRFIGEERG